MQTALDYSVVMVLVFAHLIGEVFDPEDESVDRLMDGLLICHLWT